MTTQELASTLGQMYHGAPKGEAAVMIHLFGVRYADHLRAGGVSIKDVVVTAGMSASYQVEVNKGVNLARYVSVNEHEWSRVRARPAAANAARA